MRHGWYGDGYDETQNLSQMRCEMTSSVEECALCASSAHDVHHASVCVNVVIGVLVVHCELHVVVRVHVIPLCDDAVIGLTLGLIDHVVIVVFVVAIVNRIFLYGRYTLYRKPSESTAGVFFNNFT